MTGVAIEISLVGIDALARRLEMLADMDLTRLRHGIGALVESQTRRRLHEDKTAPDGKAWAPWGPNWAATRHKGHGLLESEGDLIDSIHYLVSGGDVLVGSDLVYAAIQHFGGAEVGIPIPSREYLGLSGDDWGELVDLADAYVGRVLDQVVRA